MPEHLILLHIVKDEIETIIQYTQMIDEGEKDGSIKPIVDEIRGDEFNHALISMLMAAKIMGIKIATDDIQPDPNDIEVSQ